eukprot:Platyproteum_vivax@DN5521_c0_g1_i3.p1
MDGGRLVLDTPSCRAGLKRNNSTWSSTGEGASQKKALKGFASTILEREVLRSSGAWLSQYDLDPRMRRKVENCIDWDSQTMRPGFEHLTHYAKLAVYRCCLDLEFEAPLRVETSAEKGRCVLANCDIGNQEFILEYKGELMKHQAAKEQEQKYEESEEKGCFMYYFTVDGQRLCIDSTDEKNLAWGLGRLVNHSRLQPNMKPKPMRDSVGAIRLFFYACRDIKEGEELLFDYGERDPDTVEQFPWLNF